MKYNKHIIKRMVMNFKTQSFCLVYAEKITNRDEDPYEVYFLALKSISENFVWYPNETVEIK